MLAVQTHPTGATLFLDGKRTAPAPWKGTLGAGSHQVEARLAEHEPARMELTLVAGQTREVLLELREIPRSRWTARGWRLWVTVIPIVLAAGAVAGTVGWYTTKPPERTHPY